MNTLQRVPGLMPSNKETAIRSIMENLPVGRELINYVCGDLLGFGISRMVFEYKPEPKWVIKIEIGDDNANTIEHNCWQAVEHTPLAKWFAPVKGLSYSGRLLLQRRATVPKDYSYYPKKVPVFMTDLKYQNWGMIDKQLVCLDYAGCLLNQYGLSKQMKPAEWWCAERQ